MTFDAAAAKALISALKSHAMSLGIFGQRVIAHAPLSTPGNDLACYFELGPTAPVLSSGLSAVSIEVTFMAHVTMSLNVKPVDDVEAHVLGATTVLMNAYVGDFNLGGLVREVNIFGGLKADPGYMLFEGNPFRVQAITLPLIINDAWAEVP